MKVCSECGNGKFTATLTTRTEYTYEVWEDGGLVEESSEVVEDGDRGDIDTLSCTDCGGDFDLDELVTEAEYATEDAFGDLL